MPLSSEAFMAKPEIEKERTWRRHPKHAHRPWDLLTESFAITVSLAVPSLEDVFHAFIACCMARLKVAVRHG